MIGNKAGHRLYDDRAWLWPLWEDISASQQESELITALIEEHAKIEVNTSRSQVSMSVSL